MQTDDGTLHLEWERAADLGQAGATLCVKQTWSSRGSETLCKHFPLALIEELVELHVQGPLIEEALLPAGPATVPANILLAAEMSVQWNAYAHTPLPLLPQ